MPLAKKIFAVRRKNSGGEIFPTDNEPAGRAMGRVISLAERSLSTAARHADARSLAVPVPRGTMIPNNRQPSNEPPSNEQPLTATNAPPRERTSCLEAFLEKTRPARTSRLRKRSATVYAFSLRLRILVRKNWSDARPVPRARRMGESGRLCRKTGSPRRASWQVHGRDDNSSACFEKSSGLAGRRAGRIFQTTRGCWVDASVNKPERGNEPPGHGTPER
jgi:hypothetical protein